MKIAIIGAGAIGGMVGAKLSLAGHQVTFMARGANLKAIQTNGMKMVWHDGTVLHARDADASNDYAATGAQDLVILAIKAHQLADVASDLQHLLTPETVIVPMQNGIPFWYFHQHGGSLEGTVLKSVDPTGQATRLIPASQILGCVVYPAAELVSPGLVHHVEGERFPLGELDGSVSERVQRIAQVFNDAGLKSPVLDNIRAEMWLKLWGNLTFNPISSLTHATLEDICRFPLSRDLAASMMTEAQTIANHLGITFRVSLEKRIAGAEKVGRHKTSMLQDVEAGRLPEIDALVGSVAELGRLTNIPTPSIDAVYALVKLLAHCMHTEAGRVQLLKLAA